MTANEKKNLLIKFGFGENEAEFYLNQKNGKNAVLAVIRFLKPLNDSLKFYQGEY